MTVHDGPIVTNRFPIASPNDNLKLPGLHMSLLEVSSSKIPPVDPSAVAPEAVAESAVRRGGREEEVGDFTQLPVQ